ncbi:hypothetical protein VPHK469_0212 [Vibrio phage K469]
MSTTVPSFRPYPIEEAVENACKRASSPLSAAKILATDASPDFVIDGGVTYNFEGTEYYVRFENERGRQVVTFTSDVGTQKPKATFGEQ